MYEKTCRSATRGNRSVTLREKKKHNEREMGHRRWRTTECQEALRIAPQHLRGTHIKSVSEPKQTEVRGTDLCQRLQE